MAQERSFTMLKRNRGPRSPAHCIPQQINRKKTIKIHKDIHTALLSLISRKGLIKLPGLTQKSLCNWSRSCTCEPPTSASQISRRYWLRFEQMSCCWFCFICFCCLSCLSDWPLPHRLSQPEIIGMHYHTQLEMRIFMHLHSEKTSYILLEK